jgi:hypothetical protein
VVLARLIGISLTLEHGHAVGNGSRRANLASGLRLYEALRFASTSCCVTDRSIPGPRVVHTTIAAGRSMPSTDMAAFKRALSEATHIGALCGKRTFALGCEGGLR